MANFITWINLLSDSPCIRILKVERIRFLDLALFTFSSSSVVVVLTCGWHCNHQELSQIVDILIQWMLGRICWEWIGKLVPFPFLDYMVKTLKMLAIVHNLKILCILPTWESEWWVVRWKRNWTHELSLFCPSTSQRFWLCMFLWDKLHA